MLLTKKLNFCKNTKSFNVLRKQYIINENALKNLTSNARKCYNNNNIKLTFKSVL